jgi:HK97 family phage prohead protease
MPAIPAHNTAVTDVAWDGNAAMTACGTAACYRSISAWVDGGGDPAQRGSYKFPHHSTAGGPANLAGVRAGLSRLSQAQIPPADVAGVRNHLQTHLRAGQNRAVAPPRDDLVRSVAEFELREDAFEGPVLTGHFAVFDQWTRIASAFEGEFLEKIAPGAFKKTFRENRDGIRVLFQHGRDPIVGDKVLGPVAELREDETGAFYEVPLLDTSYNRDLLPALRSGLYGASFKFRVTKERIVAEPERSEENPDGLPEREIKEMRVFEFGPVTWPAYPSATATVRSLSDRYHGLELDSAELDDFAELDPAEEFANLPGGDDKEALREGAGPEDEVHSEGAGNDHSPPREAAPIATRRIRRLNDKEWQTWLTFTART